MELVKAEKYVGESSDVEGKGMVLIVKRVYILDKGSDI